MGSQRIGRLFALSVLSAAGAYVAGSWLAARQLARRLTAPEGFEPPRETRERLLAALEGAGAVFGELRYSGCGRDPVELSAIFASPGDPARRATILFVHGKGGAGAEWKPEALRSLSLGYNVLLPDLRGHGASGPGLFTYGLLEKDDLSNSFAAAREHYGLDPRRLGVHACSAGTAAALAFCADREDVRALWLESPFSDAGEAARHYLALATGLPERLLGLTARWAVQRAVAELRERYGFASGEDELYLLNPLRAAGRVRAPVYLVYGGADQLIPPRLVRRLVLSLPPGSEVWEAPGAGHCHHTDEPAQATREEYERRWKEFFGKNLPAAAFAGGGDG